MNRLRPLAFAIGFLVSLNAAADQTITPRFAPAPYRQLQPRVASNGTGYFSAWTEDTGSATAIYSQIINADGSLPDGIARPLDPTPPPAVSTRPHAVSVTPGRDGFFAAWVSTAGLSAVITDNFGRVEHRTAVATANQASTLAAWNGTAYLVLTTSSGPFSATVFDNNGDPIRVDIPIGDTHGDSSTRLAVAPEPGGFLILSTKTVPYESHQDLYGRRISSAGLADHWFLIRSVTPFVHGLAATSDGSHTTIGLGNDFGVWLMTLDAGAETPSTARQISASSATVTAAVSNSGRTWITYVTEPSTSTPARAFVLGIDTNGAVAPAVELGEPSDQGDDAATNGTNLLRVYINGVTAKAALAANGRVQANYDLARSQSHQQNAVIAAGGDQYLGAWDEQTATGRDIWVARLDINATPLDPAGVRVSSAPDNTNPAVAFNGKNYLIVWQRSATPYVGETVARRFSPEGKLLDSDDLVVFDHSRGKPRVIWDGTNWLVVSVRGLAGYTCSNNSAMSRVYAAQVSPEGALLDNGVPIADATGSYDQSEPDVAWSGSEYLVAWVNHCGGFHNPDRSWIAAAYVERDLTNVRPATITPRGWWGAPYVAPSSSSSYFDVRVVGGADAMVVAWQYATSSRSIVEYVTVDDALPSIAGRRRVVATASHFQMLDGELLDAERVDGANMLITRTQPPQSGCWLTEIAADGSAKLSRGLAYVVGASSTDVAFLPNGTRASVWTGFFDANAGASRVLFGR